MLFDPEDELVLPRAAKHLVVAACQAADRIRLARSDEVVAGRRAGDTIKDSLYSALALDSYRDFATYSLNAIANEIAERVGCRFAVQKFIESAVRIVFEGAIPIVDHETLGDIKIETGD